MTDSSLRRRTLRGTLWSGIERFSTQGVVLAVTIVMARELGPAAFGLVAMVLVFTDIANGIMESGFPQALVRKLDRSRSDTSTVFFFNISAAAVLYGVMCLCAHPIARFYAQPELAQVIPLLSLILPINSLGIIQKVELTSALDFRTLAKTSLCGAVAGGICGLAMTYAGCGLMSIVAFQLTRGAAECVALWVCSRWRPAAAVSWASFRELFAFGSRLAAAGILNTLYNNAVQLLIGRFYLPTSLGYYGRAHQFATLPASNLTLIIQRVSYPALCSIRDDRERLASAYRRYLRMAVFIIFPLMAGLVALAPEIVELLLGPRWSYTAVLVRILALSLMWWPVHALNLNLLQVVGRSDLFLRLEVAKKVIGAAILAATLPFGLEALCWGMVANSIAALLINTRYTGIYVGLGLLRQLRDYLPAILNASATGLAACGVASLMEPLWLKITAATAAGAILYWLIARIARCGEINEIRDILTRTRR